MLLNLRPKKYKTTVMTQRLNQVNLILFILTQVIMLILCGLALWFKKKLNNVPGNADGEGTWYVQWNNNRYSDPQLFFGVILPIL
ncbi:hypothetical protein AGDE_15155 [Angomonas deanei]|nr:hypothetical protein AGDE_15155 [Angomonas deanei]|eukprot:EPY19612.1 hypothetical protein AGDE_15155 [Angomonas deanei]